MLAQPGDKLVEAELICFVERGDESVGLLGVGREPRAIDGEKRIGGGKSRALVAVDEGWFCARLSQSAAASSMRSA